MDRCRKRVSRSLFAERYELQLRKVSHRWRLNLSVPLVEYEQTLKRVCTGGDLSSSDIESVVHFLCANASLRPIFFLWRPFLPDPKDDFLLELAVESRADFVITFNTRDFAGA